MEKLIVISFLLPIISTQVLAENILFLYPICSPSHKNVAVPVMQGLADRGHNVTVVSSFKTEPHKNIRDIIPLQEFHYFDQNALQLRSEGPMGIILMDYMHFIDYCEQIYNNEDFQQLMDQKWDLIFMDAFTNECLLGFIHKTGAPFIIISPLPVPSHIAVYTGNRLPTSYVPHFIVHFNHEMTLFQRTINVILTYLGSWGMRRALPYHEMTYRKYLGQDLPSGDEILSDVSMIFVNSHFAFNFPRPTLPDVVEIGAVHCRPGRPLPKDLDNFLSGAKDGFILFSLGSIVRPHEMPESTRKVFVNVFSRLKQRVLWKWPHDMSDISPNVKLLKWVPQQDVLAHPNIRLFMTHSGLLSTQESIYHGVPMVAIPVFGDQDLNANRATEAGIAVNVEILDITEEKLEAAINAVLSEKQFSVNVKQMSSFLRDQTETPKERAIFWAEYVMRHQGARHLRSAARELNFFQYYCLDVAAVLFIMLVVVTLAVVLTLKGIVKFSWRVLMRSPSSGKTKTQ